MKSSPSASAAPLVRVVCFSQAVGQKLAGQLSSLLKEPLEPLRLELKALESGGSTHEPEEACAVVFVLERAGFGQAAYLDALRRYVARVIEREDFRLYPLCHDMSPHELQSQASEEAREVLAQLLDTVQLTVTTGIDATARHLAAHVAALEETQKQAQWNRIRLVAAKVLGWASASLQLLSIALALGLVFWGLAWDGKVTLFVCFPLWHGTLSLGPYAGWEPLVAFVCGIAGAPFLLLLLYAYSRYGLLLQRQREERFGILYSGLASFGAPYILSLPFELHAPLPWLVLGLVSGLLLDAGRRRLYQIRREQRPVTPTTVTLRHGQLPAQLSRQAGATWLHPLRCPLLPVRQARVFISYTRASAWANQAETALATQLAAIGSRVFTDKGIREGASWRRALNTELGRCTVFISLAEPASVERAWPAAEAEAALAGRALTGLPEMLVIRAPDLPAPGAETWRWLPVYRHVLAVHEQRRDSAPRLLDYGETTAQAVAFRLHPKSYRSVGVVPLIVTELLRGLWALPSRLLLFWGSLGALLGYGAFVVLGLQLMGKADTSGWLRRHGCLEAAFVACAIALGCTLRLSLAGRYQLRHARRTHIAAMQRNGAIGLVALILLWSRLLTPLVLGWAAVMAVVAYVEADEFCAREAARDPDFLREVS